MTRSHRQQRWGAAPPQITEILKIKANRLRSLVKRFIRKEKDLRQNQDAALAALDAIKEASPLRVSTRLEIVRDAAAIVQYDEWRPKPAFDIRILNIPATDLWKVLSVPTRGGELALAPAFQLHGGTIFLHNCTFKSLNGETTIRYAHITIINDTDPRLTNPEHAALLDFRLSALGAILDSAPPHAIPQQPPPSVIATLDTLHSQFRELLTTATREEELQQFLKTNPILLGPCTQIIPKQKLGEDFVTDYVLQNTTAQGLDYTFIEIERADVRLFKLDGDQTAEFTHALRQIADWKLWLESNKAYLQKKLLQLETPKYRIILGRAASLSDKEKAYLRQMNRDFPGTSIVTYDDLLAELSELLNQLRTIQPIISTMGDEKTP